MDTPSKRVHVVIVGAGFGGIYTMKKLHSFFHGRDDIYFTIINPNNYFLFTPLLHEVATGNIWPENIIEPIRKLFRRCEIDLCLGEVAGVALKEKKVYGTYGETLYDYLVIAPGAEADFYGVEGAKEHTFTLKSLEDAIDLKNHFIHTIERAHQAGNEDEKKWLLNFVVVGGGPTGVELSAEMSDFFFDTFGKVYKKETVDKISITLIHQRNELLNHFSPSLREKSSEVLRQKGVNVLLNKRVAKVGRGFLELDGGETISAHTIVWTAGVRPKSLEFDSDIDRGSKGTVVVKEDLSIPGFPEVFVVGDIASFKDAGTGGTLRQLAQVATAEGSHAAKNIKNLVDGVNTEPFWYTHKGDLVSLGAWMAIGEIGSFKLWGHFTWWLWRTVYLSKVITWRKKIQVAVDWTLNIFSPRDISELYKHEAHKLTGDK